MQDNQKKTLFHWKKMIVFARIVQYGNAPRQTAQREGSPAGSAPLTPGGSRGG